MTSPMLSLIIPCSPQETSLPRLISSSFQPPPCWDRIISFGPNQQFKPPLDWRAVKGTSGRGRQLNRAAAVAAGEWLWFVHADSLPNEEAFRGVERFIAVPGRPGQSPRLGYCSLKFSADGPALSALNSIGANLRSHWLKLPYGDQGLCIRQRDFHALGGFREDLQRGEDLDLVVRARKIGMSIEKVDGRMETSARRYRQNGWLRTTVAHQLAAIRLVRSAGRSRSP